MAEYLIQDSTLSVIANAIRSKSGGTEPITAADMAVKIDGITNVDTLIERSITEIKSNATSVADCAFYDYDALISAHLPFATTIGQNAFYGCENLLSVNFPIATNLTGIASFNGCSKLENVSMPALTSINANAFGYCKALKSVCFPVATEVCEIAFQQCSALETVDLPIATTLKVQAFYKCTALKALILRADSVATITGTNVLLNTPVADGTGYIYVPSALVDSYRSDTNWSTYAAQLRSLEDYTVDGTATG